MMWAPVAALCAGLVALGLTPGVVWPSLTALAPGATGVARSPGLSAPGTSLPTLAIGLALGVLTIVLLRARGTRRAAPAPVWACGQSADPALRWTSAAFTKPVRLTLGATLGARTEIATVTHGGLVHEVHHHATTPHLFDTALYGPVLRAALAGAARMRRLQSGSLRHYLAYLVGLVVLLLLLARIGALG